MTGPWISGESLSPSRLNAHAGAATLLTGFSTDTLQGQSGLTVNIISDLSAENVLAGQHLQLGGAPSSASGLASIRAHSQQTDYLFFQDAAGIKSNFLLGLKTGDSNASNVDGLNLFDASDNTMIVRFSSDSVRFYPPIVAPVFDSGGALASTYNAALFLRGSSKESQIQAAIVAAGADGVARVYVPASLYPYSAGSVSFDTRVQMVREGGDWSVYDIKAYGAAGDGVTDDAAAIRGALQGMMLAGGGTGFFPRGIYRTASIITLAENPSSATWGRMSLIGEARGAAVITPESAPTFVIGSGVANLDGFQMTNLHFSLRTDIGWNNGVVRLSFVRDFTIDGVMLSGGPNSNYNQFSGYLFELDTSYNCAIRNCESWGRYTYLYELNSVTNPGEQQDTIFFERPMTSGGLQGIVRNSGGNYHNITWHNLKQFLTVAADTSADDMTALAASHGTGVSNLTVVATSSFDTNDPVLIGGGPTAEYNRITAISSGSVLALHKPTRFAQTSGASLFHGGIGVSLSDNLLNNNFYDPHFELGAVGILCYGGKELGVYNPYNASRYLIRLAGASGALDARIYGGVFAGSGSINTIVHVLSSADTSNFARFTYFGPFTTLSGSQVSLYANDAGSDRARRVINDQVAGNLTNQARYAGTSSTVTIDDVFAGGTLLHAKVLDGRAYQSGRLGIGVWPPNHGVEVSDSFGGPSASALAPTYAFSSERSLGWFRSGASTMALSQGTLSLRQGRLVSIRTAASLDSTSLTTDEMAFQIVAGSVATLAIRSGGTIYYFASSASTKG